MTEYKYIKIKNKSGKIITIKIRSDSLLFYKPIKKGKKFTGYYKKRTSDQIQNIKEKQFRIKKEAKRISKYKVFAKKKVDVKQACQFNYSSSKFDGYQHSAELDIYFDSDIVEEMSIKDYDKLYEQLWSIRMGFNKYHHCIRRLHFITFTYLISVNGEEETRHMSSHIASFYELKEEMIKTVLYILATVRSESYDIKFLIFKKLTGISVSYKKQYQSYIEN